MSALVLSTIAFSSACSLRGTLNLSQRLLKIVHERVPFAAGDFHVFVATRIMERPCIFAGAPVAQQPFP